MKKIIILIICFVFSNIKIIYADYPDYLTDLNKNISIQGKGSAALYEFATKHFTKKDIKRLSKPLNNEEKYLALRTTTSRHWDGGSEQVIIMRNDKNFMIVGIIEWKKILTFKTSKEKGCKWEYDNELTNLKEKYQTHFLNYHGTPDKPLKNIRDGYKFRYSFDFNINSETSGPSVLIICQTEKDLKKKEIDKSVIKYDNEERFVRLLLSREIQIYSPLENWFID